MISTALLTVLIPTLLKKLCIIIGDGCIFMLAIGITINRVAKLGILFTTLSSSCVLLVGFKLAKLSKYQLGLVNLTP